jgi:hypothetical protein
LEPGTSELEASLLNNAGIRCQYYRNRYVSQCPSRLTVRVRHSWEAETIEIKFWR